MKCKIFCDDDYDNLEDNVNNWLESNNIEITNIKQSIDNVDNVVLTIFYLTEKELRKKKLNKINDNDTDN